MSSEDLNETVSEIESIDHQPTPQINTSSSQTILTKEHGRWTENEHKLFLEGIMLYQNEWKNVQNHIGTRSATQARSHAQKFFIKMRKELPKQCSTLNEVKEKICNEFSKKYSAAYKSCIKNGWINLIHKNAVSVCILFCDILQGSVYVGYFCGRKKNFLFCINQLIHPILLLHGNFSVIH